MSDKELWELMSIICEGQDSEQRRKIEQYITDLQKEIERLQNIIDKAVDYIEYMQNISENKNIYVSVYDLVKILDKGE